MSKIMCDWVRKSKEIQNKKFQMLRKKYIKLNFNI